VNKQTIEVARKKNLIISQRKKGKETISCEETYICCDNEP